MSIDFALPEKLTVEQTADLHWLFNISDLTVTRAYEEMLRRFGTPQPSRRLKVENGVTVPPKTTRKNRKYPFREMEVGDSLLVENEPDRLRVYAAANTWGRLNGGRKFRVVREEKGIRAWRIA